MSGAVQIVTPGPAVEFSAELRRKISERRALYERPTAAILPVLHMVMEECGHISLEVEKAVAREMEMPLSKVHEVVSFYSLLWTEPHGKVRVDICQTTSCMLRGARELFRHMREKYGVLPGESTEDGLIAFRGVECLCSCEKAPMAQIGDDYHGPLTPEKLDEIIEAKAREIR
jgi:NADH:ubiquinone oxidoreductase subunit E